MWWTASWRNTRTPLANRGMIESKDAWRPVLREREPDPILRRAGTGGLYLSFQLPAQSV
jgi:hypothetical protein